MRRVGVALRSLRWRLALAYVALIAVLLAAFGAFQYETLRASLIANRVQEIRFDLEAAAKLYAARDQSLSRTARVALLANLMSQSAGAGAAVGIYGPAGVRIFVRPPGDDPPELGAGVFRRVLSGRPADQVVDAPNGDAQLVAGFPVPTDHALRRVASVLEVSEPMTSIDNVLGGDLDKLVIGGGVVLLLVLLLGLLLTGRALNPLRRLTRTAGALAGGDLRARSRLQPKDDEVGQLAGAFDHMADRIELAFAAQRDSEERVRRFIADASHELRTPVTALSGYIDVLRRGAAEAPGALDAALGAMSREAERLRLLVLDLLALARRDAHAEQRPEDLDLATLVARLLDEGMPGMPEWLVRDLPPEPVMVRCDPTALATALRNILSNACKYAPGARQVWSVRIDAARARIDAHDEGPGIPAPDLPHVFERFFRGEKTRSREEGGSGLGLAIVQGLIRAQGGEVAIASAEGAGTTVTVWLPLATRSTGAAPPPTALRG